MTRLAIAGNPLLEVDDGEVLASTRSYTVLTLERLRSELGSRQPLVLILGRTPSKACRAGTAGPSCWG